FEPLSEVALAFARNDLSLVPSQWLHNRCFAVDHGPADILIWLLEDEGFKVRGASINEAPHVQSERYRGDHPDLQRTVREQQEAPANFAERTFSETPAPAGQVTEAAVNSAAESHQQPHQKETSTVRPSEKAGILCSVILVGAAIGPVRRAAVALYQNRKE